MPTLLKNYMKLRKLIIIIPIIVLLGLNCKKSEELASVENIQTVFLNKNIKETLLYKKKYVVKEDVVDDDESGTNWKIISLILNGEKKITLETSWKKKDIIKRIYIFDSSVTINNMKVIGVPIKSILKIVKSASYDESFGTFYLSSKTNPNINFELDTKKIKQNSSILLKWEKNIDMIPKFVTVSAIIINSK